MNFIENIFEKISDISMRALIRMLLILGIIYLIMATDSVWSGTARTVFGIIKPFLYGFIMAYILQKPINYGVKHKIPKKIAILLIYAIGLLLVYLLLATLVPLLLDRAGGFINSMISGVSWLYSHYASMTESNTPDWIKDFADKLIQALSSFRNVIPNSISTSLPVFVTDTLSHITTFVFSTIISVYLCIDWEKLRATFLKAIGSRNFTNVRIMLKIDDEVSSYIHSMIVLMLITFVEYSLLYGLLGHKDWLILGIITSLAHLVPYVGPMAANTIGVLTALNMPTPNLIILIVMIVILSNVDPYIIQPMVHSRNTKISPLEALFSVFAFGRIFGMKGIIVAIPLFLIIRVLFLAKTKPDYLENLKKEQEAHA